MNLDVLGARFEALGKDLAEMKAVLRSVSDAITKLALVEERQTQAAASIARAFESLEKIDARLERLEAQHPSALLVARVVNGAVIAAAAGSVVYVAKHAGLM
jgi:hypothetical protein